MGFASNAAGIVVRGNGNNLSLDRQSSAVIRDNRPVGLQVQPGQTLALVGGDVSLEGGNITAPAGRIELGSVGQNGIVRLNPTALGWTLDYRNIQNFKDIRFIEAASADISGRGSSGIQVQGRRIDLSDGSAIIANTLGNASGGTLMLNASDTIEITGVSATNFFATGLYAEVAPGATGNGSNLRINTKRLQLTDGGVAALFTYGPGNTGSLVTTAESIELAGANGQMSSGFYVDVMSEATGSGGDAVINTGRLKIADGATISVSTFGSGDAGLLSVAAESVELNGTTRGGTFPSSLSSVSTATGDAGEIRVDTKLLSLSDGAGVTVSNFGTGSPGLLTITANNTILTGSATVSEEEVTASTERPSGLFAFTISNENGGEIFLNTERLSITNGATISARTFGSGNAGNLTINASDSLILSEESSLTVEAPYGGSAGNLSIQAGRLSIQDGSSVTVSSPFGEAGDAKISATSFSLDNDSTITAESGGSEVGGNIAINADAIALNFSSFVANSEAGQGGNITINADSLRLRNDSLISATAGGAGDGGNITINSDTISLLQNSDILANAVQGRGGNIQINTDALLQSPDSDISATSELGIDGEVTINTPESTLEEEIQQRQTELDSTDQLLAQSCLTQRNAQRGRFTYTGRGGQRVRPGFRIDEGEQIGTPATAQETSQVEEQPEEAVPVGANWQPGGSYC